MAQRQFPAQHGAAQRWLLGACALAQLGSLLGLLAVALELVQRANQRLVDSQPWLLGGLALLVALVAFTVLQMLLLRRSNRRLTSLLAASDARHRALVEEQSELVSLAWPDGELVYVNPAYARLFGRTPQQMTGTSLYEPIAEDERPQFSQLLAQVLDKGKPRNGEQRMRMTQSDGPPAERWIAWAHSLQQDPQGRALLRSVGRDITERKQAELALRASQAFLARTGRVARVGGWEYDIASGAMNWSEQTRRTHDVGPDYRPTLQTAVAFFTPEARPALQRAVTAATERGQGFELELPLITATGRPIHVQVVGEVETEDGRPIRIVGACQDITERKRLEQSLADNERFLRQLTDSLPVRMAYFDHQRRYRFVNLAHCKRFGLPREQIIGRTRSEMTRGSSDAIAEPHIDGVLHGMPQQFEFDEVVGGRRVRIESRLIPDIAPGGRVRGYFSTGVDITERSAASQAQRELSHQLQRQAIALQAIIEAIPAMVFVVSRDGDYRYVNRGFERWAGRSRDELIGHRVEQVLGDQEYAQRQPWISLVLSGESVSFEHEYKQRGLHQHLAISYVPLRLADGTVDGFIGVSQDITQHRQEEVRLLQLAHRDALTGLLNRSGLAHCLDRRALNPEHAGGGLALLYIDLDFFKAVNDQHGHDVGDQLLQAFGQRLQTLVRPSDAVARLGGDEFAIVLMGLRERLHAQAVADKVLAVAATPFSLAGLTLTIGASVGVVFSADFDAEFGAEEADVPTADRARRWKRLMVRADELLYSAKAAGRGRQAVSMEGV